MASQKQNFKVTVHWLESSRAQRILILLEELSIEYDMKTYKRDENGFAPLELAKVHPLGKSPAVVMEVPNQKPLVLAESAVICAYIAEHRGKHLIPTKYIAGREGQPLDETEAWMRNNYFEQYIEGSLMTLGTVAATMLNIKNSPVPFFIKPITRMIAGSVNKSYPEPNFKTHFDFLKERLATS